MKVNTILKQTRVKRGLTQVQVAEKAQITESGQEPKIKTALLIAQALNTTVEELFPVALHSQFI